MEKMMSKNQAQKRASLTEKEKMFMSLIQEKKTKFALSKVKDKRFVGSIPMNISGMKCIV
jgi:hypothetical protein